MHPNLLDQLRIFRAVVECGTFSSAAEALNKTVSSVSYTVSNLEKHLNGELLDRSQYRPALTEFGKMVYEDADQVLRRVDRFAARVGLHNAGHQARLTVSVDVTFPRQVLVAAIAAFAGEYPMVSVTVIHRETDTITEEIRSGVSDLGLVRFEPRLTIRDIDARVIGTTQNLVVVAPDHPLAQLGRPVTLPELDDHRQIILSRAPVPKTTSQYLMHKSENWCVGDDEILRAFLKAGLGWAYANRHVVQTDIDAGALVALVGADVKETSMNRLAVIWRVTDPFGGPRQRLCELLEAHFPAAYPEGLFEEHRQWGEADTFE